MADAVENLVSRNKRRSRLRWIAALVLLLLVSFALTMEFVISHAEPILRARVVETLTAHFHSKVELEGFHVWLADGLEVSGSGLKIYGQTDPNIQQPGIQPLIGIGEFHFRTGLLALLHSPMHVQQVRLKG